MCAAVKVSWVYLPGYKTPYMLDDPVTEFKKKKKNGEMYRYASLNDGNTFREMSLGDFVVVRTSQSVLTQPYIVQYSLLHT